MTAPLTYLVTGGAGFIGSHLTDALIDRGHTVVVLDDLSGGHRANLAAAWPDRKLRFVRGSVLDGRLLDELTGRCDAVVQLAPVDVRLVAETACRYGLPLLLAPSRASDELLALGHHREHGLPVTVARLPDTAGPRQSPGALVPRLAAQAVAGRPLTVHGDGTGRRRLTHVADAVDGLLRLLALPDTSGEILDIGGAQETTTAELAALVAERSGTASPLRFLPYEDEDGGVGERRDGMATRGPDVTGGFRALTGWEPKLGLAEIVDAALADARGSVPGPAAPALFPPAAAAVAAPARF
ncbi:NAD-dependent epimerase/dehydratase family protein [Streptomyces kunmingensis]|uniref:NAD-dependent epimerase/dehydratase family protein n=1 Tax=Streptomyces kunmingensis TaxID=68225 RepID=A0ABU6CFP7_9ACTN|nr:NAD-dependent epimerase/dehydratase family protein [Streptomyces kunmingensis]MEB3963536.1 NAD-dependent epimerase/dehydratase family protein [Streptomyces kunmingensis]